ncbi:hypothetical protein [Methylocaldum szegediense]|uniref:Uncharacterized protein n=1 Tax=Methylocaldum szegediense TaxID=73780 RepID=A0ABM9I8L1_9GAMM|nr:hypothetical protein [Methylocaldum szegediense]CAI8960859.1 conserved exported protein of unknown function [Methylocaldum szegediense]
MPSYRTIVLLTALTAIGAQAGTLTDGKWTPSNCGTQTAPPEIDSRSVEGYNRSLKAVREWQQKTQAYNDCVVKEANADNAAIAEAANAEQARFRAAVERISAEAAAIKAKLERQ